MRWRISGAAAMSKSLARVRAGRGEGPMFSHVPYNAAVNEHTAPVAQRAQIFGSGPQGNCLSADGSGAAVLRLLSIVFPSHF